MADVTTMQRRALGVLPVAFLGYALTTYEQGWELLWMCNLSNLVLALGLLGGSGRLVWVATLWLLVGAPLWVWDLFVRGDLYVHSVLTHIAAPCLGLWAVRGRAPVRRAWVLASVLGIAVQALCRAITPAELNINASHAPYQGVTGLIAYYPVYWAVNILVLGVVLFALERALTRWVARAAAGAATARGHGA